ncbi:hypothetical protein K443DRAFT_683759, partial [Laccaria amethystina LaAM-08-1]
MAKHNSQSSKESKSSKQSQGWRPWRKLFSKSPSTTPTQSTSSLALLSSTVDSRDQPKSSAQQATLTTTSLDQFHGLASNPPENRQTAPKPGSSTKDSLKVTGRAILTLAKRLPDIADPNPVKIALGLVKLIIEIQKVRRGSSHCSPPDYLPRLWQTI